MNIAEIGQMFAAVNEERRNALNEAVKACHAVNEGDAIGDFGAGFEAGCNACIDAIETLANSPRGAHELPNYS